jgi:hypothetical protein
MVYLSLTFDRILDAPALTAIWRGLSRPADLGAEGHRPPQRDREKQASLPVLPESAQIGAAILYPRSSQMPSATERRLPRRLG